MKNGMYRMGTTAAMPTRIVTGLERTMIPPSNS
jgi:hypothetical protein